MARSLWQILWLLSSGHRTAAVAGFARDEGIDAAHRVVLVLDQAGSHTRPTHRLPVGLDLIFLPIYPRVGSRLNSLTRYHSWRRGRRPKRTR